LGLLGFLALFLALFFLCFCCFAPCEDCCSPVLVPAGSGVLDVLVVVVLVLDEDDEGPDPCFGTPFFGGEVEVEVEPVEAGVVEDVEDGGAAEVVVVVVLVVVAPTDSVAEVDGAHRFFSETITPRTGSRIAEMGVPGATFLWKT
jgi:hypothetical protein